MGRCGVNLERARYAPAPRTFDTVLALNELAYGAAAPKEEIHLQLLGALIDDGALNAFLLDLAERTPSEVARDPANARTPAARRPVAFTSVFVVNAGSGFRV